MHLPNRLASIVAAASFASACLLLFAQLAADDLKPEIGDWSVRYLSAINFSDATPFASLFSKDMLTAIWPPGHTAFHNLVLASMDPRTPEEAFFSYSSISIVFWASGIAAAFFAARQVMPAFFAYLTVPVLMASPMIQRYSYSGMTDILSVSLFLIATLLVVLYLTKDRLFLAFLAGLVMLFASTMRHEVMVYSFLLFLYLLFAKRIKAAFLYGVFAGGLPTVRVIYAFIFDHDNEGNFLRFNRRELHVTDPMKELFRLYDRVRETEEVYLVFCLILLIFSAGVLLVSVTRRSAANSDDQLLPNSKHGALFVFVTVSIVLVLAASTLSGSNISHARYAMPVLPFLGLATLWIVSLAFKRLYRLPRLTTVSAYVIICLTVVAFVDAQKRFQETRPRFLPQEEALIDWLQKQQTDLILFDYLAYKEFPILAMLQTPGEIRASWAWASQKEPKRSPPKELLAFERQGDKLTFEAHSYIVDIKPEFIVMASDERHAKIVSSSEGLRKLIPHRFRDSYLRPFLTRNGDSECLDSPYIDETPCFNVVYENSEYRVLTDLDQAF